VRFGANYVPTEHWWYSWSNWKRDSIRRDLQDIAALNADHIRIQALWPQFQPNANEVNAEALSRLEQLLDDADAIGLDVEVTVLDGQLSGFLFVPAFLIDNRDGHVRNVIRNRDIIAAQKRLFMAMATRIGSHPRFMGFDIANEIYWFTQPLKIAFTPAQGDAWMEEILTYCARIAPGKLHVNGVDKWPYEAGPQGFTRRALGRAGSASCVHPWAGFGPIYSRYGPLSTAATHYSEFLVQYMQAFSHDGKRSIWIEEDGCSKQWMREDLIPRWAEASIRHAASCDHLFGITWWCSHDVNRRYTGFNKLEYDLGLYSNDRKLKPLGRMYQSLIREFDQHPPSIAQRRAAIVIPDAMGSDDMLAEYMRHIERGVGPQVVLASRRHDNAYLRSRGITHLIQQ
jgi:endo-1,4-beta-mannosidase